MLQDKKIKSVDERAEAYLDMLREEQYLQLTTRMDSETPEAIVAFCRLVAKYESVERLTFVRELLSSLG